MGQSTSVEITLGLPCYNEQDNILAVLEESAGHLDRLDRSWEMIVVDNHSSDRTADKVREYASHDPRVRLIVHETNRFYSGSCKTILENFRGEYVAIMDSDGQFTAQDLPAFLAELEQGANLVLGWRRERKDPWTRKVMSKGFGLLARYWLGFRLHDLNVGLRMFDRAFASCAIIRHTINMVNPELFTRAMQANLKVTEVPIHHSERTKGATSHNFRKLFKLVSDVTGYFRSLSRELRDPATESVTVAEGQKAPSRAA